MLRTYNTSPCHLMSLFAMVVVVGQGVLTAVKVYHTRFEKDGPNDYCRNNTTNCSSRIPVFAGQLTMPEYSLGMDYDRVGMCPGLGTRKRSYHLLNYTIDFGRDEVCTELCTRSFELNPTDSIDGPNELTQSSLETLLILTAAIKANYRQQLNVDNLPVTWCYAIADGRGKQISCKKFFSIGCYVDKNGRSNDNCYSPMISKPNTYYLFNHLEFLITYNELESRENVDGPGDGRITSIKVILKSLDHSIAGDHDERCGDTPMAFDGSLSKMRSMNITYSYSVTFIKDDLTSWKTRRAPMSMFETTKYETFELDDFQVLGILSLAGTALIFLEFAICN